MGLSQNGATVAMQGGQGLPILGLTLASGVRTVDALALAAETSPHTSGVARPKTPERIEIVPITTTGDVMDVHPRIAQEIVSRGWQLIQLQPFFQRNHGLRVLQSVHQEINKTLPYPLLFCQQQPGFTNGIKNVSFSFCLLHFKLRRWKLYGYHTDKRITFQICKP